MTFDEIIPLEIFCSSYQVEQTFLETLEAHGLISFRYQENQRFILKEDVVDLEKYSRMYYEMEINVAGIDALKNVLEKVKQLQQETEQLKARLRIYE